MSTDMSPNMVPNLRFPEFRDTLAWKQTPLRDAFNVIANGQANAQDHQEDGAYPLFDRSEVIKRSSTFLFDAQAVILPGEGMSFQPRYFNGKFNLHQRAYALMEPTINARFAFHAVDRFKGILADNAVKSTVLSLRMPIIEKFFIPCPMKNSEQQKIAECLGSLDELITATDRKLKALRQHKQGVMQQLFPQPGETVPRLRFPEFQNCPDWKAGHCRDVARVFSGYGFPDKFQGNERGQFPFYKVSDISRAVEEGKTYITDASNYIESDVLQEIRGKLIPSGTTIFAKIGEAIKSNRRVVTTIPAVIDNNTAGVKAIKTKTFDEFLFYIWSNISLIDHAGGVVPAVSKSALESVPLYYPSSIEEQQRIVNCLGSLDELVATMSRRLKTLRQHKQGLMQQLFPSLHGQ